MDNGSANLVKEVKDESITLLSGLAQSQSNIKRGKKRKIEEEGLIERKKRLQQQEQVKFLLLTGTYKRYKYRDINTI